MFFSFLCSRQSVSLSLLTNTSVGECHSPTVVTHPYNKKKEQEETD